MRKTLIVAAAALTALAVAVVGASAQTPSPGAETTVTVSPADAGTKRKPKPAKIKLTILNEDSSQTADRLQIFHAKQIKASGKGLTKCSRAKLETVDPAECPRASRLGVGTADAVQDVNGRRNALKFNVTAFLRSNNSIAFMIRNQDQSVPINVLAIGTFKRASGQYGTVLDVPIPQLAREFPPGTFNGLVGLQTTLFKKKGKNSLYKTTGCTSARTLPFRTVIHFQPNPNPPKAEEVVSLASADCRR